MRSKKYGIQPVPPSDSATVRFGNRSSMCDHTTSAAACTMFIGVRVYSTSIGASLEVTTSCDDVPMCMQTTVPTSEHASHNRSQASVWMLAYPSLLGFSENVMAWQ